MVDSQPHVAMKPLMLRHTMQLVADTLSHEDKLPHKNRVTTNEEKQTPSNVPSNSFAGYHPIFGKAVADMAVGIIPTDEPLSVGKPQTETVTLTADSIDTPVVTNRDITIYNADFVDANYDEYTYELHRQQLAAEETEPVYHSALRSALYAVSGALLVAVLRS